MHEKILAELSEVITFVEGALGVDMSQAWDSLEEMRAEKLGEFPISVHFPSTTAKTGWFSDSLEFASVNEAVDFFHDVKLLVIIGRLQQREPHKEYGEPKAE